MNKIRYILQIIFPICVQKEDNTGYALGWGLVCMFPSGSWSDPPLPHHFTNEWPHGSYVDLLYTVYDLRNKLPASTARRQTYHRHVRTLLHSSENFPHPRMSHQAAKVIHPCSSPQLEPTPAVPEQAVGCNLYRLSLHQEAESVKLNNTVTYCQFRISS